MKTTYFGNIKDLFNQNPDRGFRVKEVSDSPTTYKWLRQLLVCGYLIKLKRGLYKLNKPILESLTTSQLAKEYYVSLTCYQR